MLLHHSITIYLLFGSYFINIWECGIVISYLHDVADILGHFVKTFSQTKLMCVTVPVFFSMMAVWGWHRNIMLPFCIYHVWTQGLKDNVFDRYVFPETGVTLPIYCYLLSLLVVLHYYWFYLFLKIFCTWQTTGKAEDIQGYDKRMERKLK